MPQALISLNGVNGSNPPNGTPLPIDTAVTCNNTNSGGEITYLWEFLDKPENSSATFSNPAIQNPIFTPDVEGTYLIRLKVNATLVSEQIDTAIAAVLQEKTNLRIPAALETTEESALRGWAQAVNRQLKLLTNLKGDPGTFICISNGGHNRGDVILFEDGANINSGLPEEEFLPIGRTALATSATDILHPLFVVEGAIDGNTTVAAGALMHVRAKGFHGPVTVVGAPTPGDPVYLSDTGTISETVGTEYRLIGKVVYATGSDYYILVDGTLGAGTAPSTANYLVQGGSTAGLPNAIDIANIGSPLTFTKAGIGGIAEFRGNGNLYLQVTSSGIFARNSVGISTGVAETLPLSSGSYISMCPSFGETWRFTTAGTLEAQGGNRLISNVANPVGNQDAATKLWVLDTTFYLMNYTFGNAAVAGGGTTSYMDPFWVKGTSGVTEISLEVPIACTAVLATVRSTAAGGVAAEDIVYTVRKNGADTALVVTCPNTDTSASAIGAIAFAQGDKVSVKAVASAGAANPANNIFEIRFSTAV